MDTNTENDVLERWVNLEEVANYLSVSKDTIRAWIKHARYLSIAPEKCTSSKYLK